MKEVIISVKSSNIPLQIKQKDTITVIMPIAMDGGGYNIEKKTLNDWKYSEVQTKVKRVNYKSKYEQLLKEFQALQKENINLKQKLNEKLFKKLKEVA